MKLNLNAIRKQSVDPERPLPSDPAAYRAWIKRSTLDSKVEELRQRRRVVQAELVAIPAPARETGGSDLTRRAEILLDGKPRSMRDGPDGHPERLRREIAEIDAALHIADQRRQQEQTERIGGELVRRQDEWNALAIKTALALAEVRRLETQRQAFLASLVGMGGPPRVPTWQFSLTGLFVGGAPAIKLIEEATKLGLVTKKEIS